MTTPFHAKYWAHSLLLAHPRDGVEALSRSIGNARVDLNPHQVDAALFALRSPYSKGVLLADEVGLGKTIEAALILAQKWAERRRRILLIVPATLRKQWQVELEDKFFLPSVILEAKAANALAKKGLANPFLVDDRIVICSYQFVYSKRDLVQQVDWDLVVIDEAHRLRSIYKGTKTAEGIVDSIRPARKLLLTATPLQNSLLELYGLVSILDPELFGGQEAFQAQFMTADDPEERDTALRERIKHVCKRTLRRQVLEYIPFTQRFTHTADENQRVVRQVEGRKGQAQLFDDVVHINVFNISKLNKDTSEKKGTPRIKRLSEYIGQSYFEYLAELDDLVLLMDESHRYRADAGVRVLNELRPVLGLELTATPQTENSRGTTGFKNIIYSYPLSEALKDGFVKEPAVATRKDFVASNYSKDELERLKLEDAIRVHESVKVDLEVYARESGAPVVKPFVLVIAESVEHASSIETTIKDDQFFEGRYRERVITVHSKLKGEDEDKTIESLLAVEQASEPTEIVIHVNMLKEGWDVTNLYTIVPLRAANSKTLIEQSIGRGLRLPFGRRTGVAAIDRLTIIAHDKFQSIIDEASKPDSIIRTGVVIGVDVPATGQQAVAVPTRIEAQIFGSVAVATSADGSHSTLAGSAKPAEPTLVQPEEIEVAKLVLEQIGLAAKDPVNYPSAASLASAGSQALLIRDVAASASPAQAALPGFQDIVTRVVGVVTSAVAAGTISIPRIVVVPTGEVTCGYHNFDLDLSGIRYQPVEQSILLKHLRDSSVQDEIGVEDNGPAEARPEDYVLRALIDFDDVDYQSQAQLLNKLASQVVAHLRTYLTADGDVRNVVLYYQRSLANFVHAQMEPHFWHKATAFEARVHQGFENPAAVNYVVPYGEGSVDFRAAVAVKSEMRTMLFGGFRKCLYAHQKFDTDPERRFAVVLEDDKTVEKWFKPARKVFQIDYACGEAYEPDFVVETATEKFMVEVKRADQLDHPEVQAKARAAVTWCRNAADHERTNSGKPWRYVLIPHDVVTENMSLAGLAAKYAKSEA